MPGDKPTAWLRQRPPPSRRTGIVLDPQPQFVHATSSTEDNRASAVRLRASNRPPSVEAQTTFPWAQDARAPVQASRRGHAAEDVDASPAVRAERSVIM